MKRIICGNDELMDSGQFKTGQDALMDSELERGVSEIIANVKKKGDEALISYTKLFDRVDLSRQGIKVAQKEFKEARNIIDERFISVVGKVRENVERFYQKTKPVEQGISGPEGEYSIQRVEPLSSVGVYVPGGTAPLVSTVLMTVCIARVAGVSRIALVTPPNDEGSINPYILTACSECGIDEVYKIGGAQAIAALAFGTKTISKVDKIVGPGNKYVTAAKRLVYGFVDIDMVAGPSEVLVLADNSAQASFIAADLLSQAEHDPDSRVFLVTDSVSLADNVEEELEKQLMKLKRSSIASQSLHQNGSMIITKTIDQAIEIANLIAPEHCEVIVQDAEGQARRITNAGAVFVGAYTPESVGDYMAGPSHVLPTGGTARFFSGLSIDSFMRKSSLIYYTKEAFLRDVQDIEYIAHLEGLDAHERAASIRKELEKDGK